MEISVLHWAVRVLAYFIKKFILRKGSREVCKSNAKRITNLRANTVTNCDILTSSFRLFRNPTFTGTT
jgi:hypothetical protein